MRHLLLCFLFVTSLFFATSGETPAADVERPRLIVVVSVDQLPAQYLEQWQHRFADDGFFKRLMNQGAWFTNCHHRHAFTTTGPGHSTMLTGTDPSRTGIVGNSWFQRATGATVNCVGDDDVAPVGAPGAEPASPRNLLVPTLGDQLKLATHGKSKVYGVSWKDRAGILMSGHAADASYWFDEDTGKWITSTFYRNDLPGYLRNLNEGNAAEQYAGKSWELLHPIEQYDQTVPDDNPYETDYPGFGRAFPHPLPKETNKLYYMGLGLSPFGSELTLAVASLILEYEQLGQDEATDVLCIGLSANDYVGHAFGPQSLEVQDILLRTDLLLAQFVELVQRKLGDAPWLLALTSDHGVAPIPELAAALKLPAVRNPLGDLRALETRLEERLRNEMGSPSDGRYVQKVDGVGVYLRSDLPELAAGKFERAQEIVRTELLSLPHLAASHTRAELLTADAGEGLGQQFRRAFHSPRSPDVLYVLAPYCLSGSNATTHGSPWPYDTHVPLFIYGSGIKPARYTQRVAPAHLGPTLAHMLGVMTPAGSSVEPIDGLLQTGGE